MKDILQKNLKKIKINQEIKNIKMMINKKKKRNNMKKIIKKRN